MSRYCENEWDEYFLTMSYETFDFSFSGVSFPLIFQSRSSPLKTHDDHFSLVYTFFQRNGRKKLIKYEALYI